MDISASRFLDEKLDVLIGSDGTDTYSNLQDEINLSFLSEMEKLDARMGILLMHAQQLSNVRDSRFQFFDGFNKIRSKVPEDLSVIGMTDSVDDNLDQTRRSTDPSCSAFSNPISYDSFEISETRDLSETCIEDQKSQISDILSTSWHRGPYSDAVAKILQESVRTGISSTAVSAIDCDDTYTDDSSISEIEGSPLQPIRKRFGRK